MSVIIRLQNLPLSAKSGDIRQFFRGLRIPDGGVHILGGEKGDAFIAFNSDEDARIAMRKDRGKIKDSKVKLLLSSYLEMQHEIERITKYESTNSSNKWRGSAQSRQSPLRNRDRSSERSLRYAGEDYRSYSRAEERHVSRRHSPRRSRSFERSLSDEFRRSPSSRQRSPSSRGISPRRNTPDNYADSYASEKRRKYSAHHGSEQRIHDPDYYDNNSQNEKAVQNNSPSRDEQRQLEERIAKALNTGFVENAFGISSSAGDKLSLEKQMPQRVIEQFPPQPFFNSSVPDPSMLMNNFPPLNMNNSNFVPGMVPMNPVLNVQPINNPATLPPPPFFSVPGPPAPPMGEKAFIPFTGYYVTISGLDPLWTNSDLQMMLKGVFAPQDNIKWEVDDSGFKTGTAFLKVMNKDDFKQIVAQITFIHNDRLITVSECPNSVYEKYFPPPSVPPLPGQAIIQDGELYYKVKGLPYTITHEEVMHFFYGFQIADVYLECFPSGKMTGEGYICFANIADYERARLMHGKKLGFAFIEMIPCSRQEMLDCKRRNKGYFNPNPLAPLPQAQLAKPFPIEKRPLCVLLTGLPFFINVTKLRNFFHEHGGLQPDAVHLVLNQKRKTTGRGFAEFTSIRQFDAALKCHGSKIGESMICVKQILYDEMTKILSTHKGKHDYLEKYPALAEVDLPHKDPPVWQQLDQDHFSRNSNGNRSQYNEANSFNRMHSNQSNFVEDFPVPFKKDNFNAGHDKNKNFLNRNRNEKRRFLNPVAHHPIQNDFDDKGSNDYPERSSRNVSDDYPERSSHKESDDYPERSSHKESDDYPERSSNKEFDDIRMPVKFEVKNKQPVAKNTKADDAFDRSMKGDVSHKLSKLTPEKEIEIVKVITNNKVVREVKNKDPESRGRRRSRSPSLDKQNDKVISFSRKGEERGRKGRPYRRSPGRYSSPHRLTQSPVKRGYYDEDRGRMREDSPPQEVVVEMSYVHPLVGSLELLDFFRGFNVTEDRMIRRYSDVGEPLGDIRVTFSSLREAERAVKYLSGHYLNGIPIDMFIV